MRNGLRVAVSILFAVLAMAWIGISIRYGPDPNTPPVVRYSMITFGVLLMPAMLIVKRYAGRGK